MKVIILGTAGYHPNDRRDTLCVMLPELGIVFDAGTGFYRVRDYLETSELQIFLSHAHLDHCIGLTFLFDVLHERQVHKTIVRGEPEKLEAIQQHLFSPLLFPAMPPLTFEPLRDESTSMGDNINIRYFPLSHPGGSVGYRVDAHGKSLAYVTDTVASIEADYLQHIHDVDLLIHECYFPDGYEELATKTGHSCTSHVAEVARRVNAKQLLLTHFNPLDVTDDPIDLNKARSIFPNTALAEDRQEIVIDARRLSN